MLRFAFNDNNSSYVDLLKRGNFLSLSAYRIMNLSMEIFKCCHGMNPMYLNDLFCKKKKKKHDLRDKTSLEQPKFSTKTYKTFKSKLTVGVIPAISINLKYSDLPFLLYALYLYVYVFLTLQSTSYYNSTYRSFWIWVYFYWGHYYLQECYVLCVNFRYTQRTILPRFSQNLFIIMHYLIFFILPLSYSFRPTTTV